MQKVIDVGTLNLTQQHIDLAIKVLKSNRLSYGPLTSRFENEFAKIHGNQFGIMTNSGTAALTAVIHALKIINKWKDGDEIIIPATTFVATYNVVLHNNLKPVLVDIDYDFNIDPTRIEKKITKKTKAIMPVHLLGKPAKMKEIKEIAKRRSLKIIEDSCETMFVEEVGSGDVACFSFYVAHLLVTGVGGMAITNDEKLANLIRSLIFHGRDNQYLKLEDDDIYNKNVIDARFRFNYPGYSARSTEVEAALGLIELKHYRKMLRARRSNAQYLAYELNRWTNNMIPLDYYYQDHAFMMFPYMHEKRDELMLFMEKRNITTRTLMPLLNQPYIRKTIKLKDYPMANNVLKHGLLFGCHQDLTRQDLDYIIQTIKDFEND